MWKNEQILTMEAQGTRARIHSVSIRKITFHEIWIIVYKYVNYRLEDNPIYFDYFKSKC